MKTIHLLIITDQYDTSVHFPETVTVTVAGTGSLPLVGWDEKMAFQVVLLKTPPAVSDMEVLKKKVEPYTLFFMDHAMEKDPQVFEFLMQKKAVYLEPKYIQSFADVLPYRYWEGQYGDKLAIDKIDITPAYTGNVSFIGYNYLMLETDFRNLDTEYVSWKYNYNVEENEPLELWPEYVKSPGVEVKLCIRFYERGSVDGEIGKTVYEDLTKPVVILMKEKSAYIHVALQINGKGKIGIGPVHVRQSRLSAGSMLPGGKCIFADNRREFFCFFHPGDRKPPLNVYFSGFRSAEGFEGYHMMEHFDAPFLLLADPRVHGGAYYIGTPAYEAEIEKAIRDTLKELHFTKEQLILSGLSMGSVGAVYYASKLEPHAVIVGKPLLNLGNIAANEKTIRPGGFPTSLDVLQYMEGDMKAENIQNLNDRIWKAIDSADFSKTAFAVAYMMQDDYDSSGYPDLVEHLERKKVRVYGKGVPGRHNDNTAAIVKFFKSQYRRILHEDFGRDV